MNNKQQQLTFSKGITNVPSDALCSDNTLEESVGLVYSDSEHRVIQKPKNIGSIDGTLVYVHTSSSSERYIVTKNGKVWWFHDNTLSEICSYSGELSVDAVGGILVLAHGDGTVYAMWKNGGYELISGLPDFNFFPLTCAFSRGGSRAGIKVTRWPLNIEGSNPYGLERAYYHVNNDGSVSAGHVKSNDNSVVYTSRHEKERDETFQNDCIGYMEEFLDGIKEEGGFAYPFWVRFGIEMYDGSITRLSSPILMCPSVRYNGCFVQKNVNGGDPEYADGPDNDALQASATWSYLHFAITGQNLTDMRDVIKSIKVYVSQEVKTSYINEDDWEFYCPVTATAISYKSDEVSCFSDGSTAPCKYESEIMDTLPNVEGGTGVRDYYRSYVYPKRKTDTQIMRELVDNSVFYELCEVPYDDIFSQIQWQTEGGAPHSDYRDGDIGFLNNSLFMAEELMEHHALLNLTTQTQLPHDDYQSHSIITSAKLFSYNSRLNMFDIERKLFEGFNMFSSENTAEAFSFRAEVHILTDEGTRIVYTDFLSNFAQGYWFFYPDSRATKAILYINKNNTWYELVSMALTEHPSLNGAYYFGKLPYETGSVYGDYFTPGEDHHYNPTKTVTLVDNRDDIEALPNTIITTEVNNPMVYYAEGFNQVGTGKIMALATQTVALSSGTEFGSQPIIVFTDKGLWSMAVSRTGLYDYTKPLPREVCSNPRSVTQVDGAVFFASEKGLMVVVGSEVKCISEQLSGKANGINISDGAFQDYLKNAFIAYDYRDSLLWIFNPDSGYATYCYIYSMKTGTFAKYYFTSAITNIVDNYPDYLLQSGTSVFSLLNRPNINSTEESANTYTATMITRPMKLENALALKSIMQVKHIHDMQGSLTLRIFASNKLSQSDSDWVELFSLRGVPWKYYKFRYDFTGLKATDRFAGTMLITQERRIDKLR